jgi:transposase-like protein
MFVAGTSTQKVGEVAQTLMGVAPSASPISRLNQSLTQPFETWRRRPLQEQRFFPIFFIPCSRQLLLLLSELQLAGSR